MSSSDSPDVLAASGLTIPSDSENYSHAADSPPSPPESSSSPLILYSPPTLWGLLRGAAINLLLPFVNGLMLGFGELVANEAAYRLGWSGTKVRCCPAFAAVRVCFARAVLMLLLLSCRFSQRAAPTRGVLALASRCVRILSSGGGGMARSSTCTRPSSRRAIHPWAAGRASQGGLAVVVCITAGVWLDLALMLTALAFCSWSLPPSDTPLVCVLYLYMQFSTSYNTRVPVLTQVSEHAQNWPRLLLSYNLSLLRLIRGSQIAACAQSHTAPHGACDAPAPATSQPPRIQPASTYSSRSLKIGAACMPTGSCGGSS